MVCELGARVRVINRPRAFLGFAKGPTERKPKPEEVDICKLARVARGPRGLSSSRTVPPAPPPRPATGRGKRRLEPRVDTPAAKRPKAAQSAAQQQQVEHWRNCEGTCGSWRLTGWPKKSAQQEWLIAHLERFNAQVLEENGELRRLLENGAVDA